jgi:hypothetical protein
LKDPSKIYEKVDVCLGEMLGARAKQVETAADGKGWMLVIIIYFSEQR